MRHWRSLIEKDFLGAWDLTDAAGNPKDYTLRISAVDTASLKTRETPKGKRKCVISFHGAKKRMVANSTNCELIEGMYGPDVDKWVGQSITLYQGDVRNPKGGGTIKGVKVRPKKPTGAPETIVEKPVDEAMRAEQDAAFDRGGNPDEY